MSLATMVTGKPTFNNKGGIDIYWHFPIKFLRFAFGGAVKVLLSLWAVRFVGYLQLTPNTKDTVLQKHRQL